MKQPGIRNDGTMCLMLCRDCEADIDLDVDTMAITFDRNHRVHLLCPNCATRYKLIGPEGPPPGWVG